MAAVAVVSKGAVCAAEDTVVLQQDLAGLFGQPLFFKICKGKKDLMEL